MPEDEDYLTPEFVDVDVRLSFSFLASEVISRVTEIARLCGDNDVVPLSQFLQITATAATGNALGHITVKAYDGITSVEYIISEVTVLQPGSALIPPKQFINILKIVGKEKARVDCTGTEIKIRSGHALWTVPTSGNESLPVKTTDGTEEWVTVDSEEFVRAVEAVLPAVAKSNARPALTQVDLNDGYLVACDGARVHRVEVNIPGVSTTIPRKSLEFVRNLAKTEEGYFQFYADDSKIIVRTPSTVVRSQKLLTKFPDVSKLLLRPAIENQDTLAVNADKLRTAIHRVGVGVDKESSAVWLGILSYESDSGKSWKLRVKSKNGVGVSAVDEIPVEWTGGARSVDICVNHEYLLDMIKPFDETETVFFSVGEDTKKTRKELFVEDKSMGYSASLAQMYI